MAMRTRTKSTVAIGRSGICTQKYYTGVSNNINDYAYSEIPMSWNSSSSVTVMEDVVSPNFKTRMAQGEVINNPMSVSTIETIPPQGTPYRRIMLRTDGSGRILGWDWGGVQPVPESLLGSFLEHANDPSWQSLQSSLRDQAVTKAHANASSAEISLLMTAGEAHKTVASMGQILKRVYRVARAARKLDLKFIRNELSVDELKDRYMELRYAIRPLMYDARDVQSALEESKLYKTTRATARGFAKDTWSKSDTFGCSLWEATGTVAREVTVTSEFRAGVLAAVTSSNMSVWGLDQVLETGWELIPFSFIVDWFCDVGNKIAAFAPSVGVQELASWVTGTHTVTKTNSLASIANNSSYLTTYANVHTWTGSKIQKEYVRVREVNPTLSFFPNLNVRLDSLKLLDLSIITQKLLRSNRR